MVKNIRMEFRVDKDTKENFEWKAKQLEISQTELFEVLCNFDIGLYGRDLKRIKNLKNNESNSLRNNSSSEILKIEEEE